MNKLEMQYKADTGERSKIGFECSVYKYFTLNVDNLISQYFDTYDGILQLHTPEYIKWLEDKIEAQPSLTSHQSQNQLNN